MPETTLGTGRIDPVHPTSSDLVPTSSQLVRDEVTASQVDLVSSPRPSPLGEGLDGDEVAVAVRGTTDEINKAARPGTRSTR